MLISFFFFDAILLSSDFRHFLFRCHAPLMPCYALAYARHADVHAMPPLLILHAASYFASSIRHAATLTPCAISLIFSLISSRQPGATAAFDAFRFMPLLPLYISLFDFAISSLFAFISLLIIAYCFDAISLFMPFSYFLISPFSLSLIFRFYFPPDIADYAARRLPPMFFAMPAASPTLLISPISR